jgi:hypothetical protein
VHWNPMSIANNSQFESYDIAYARLV